MRKLAYTDHPRYARIIPWLYGLILLGIIFRFFYPFISHPLGHLYSDPARHYYNSLPDTFNVNRIETVFDPLLPQLELMAVFFIFGNSIIGLGTYFGLLSASMPWFWYRWARELFDTKTQALVFTTIIVFLPSWLGIYAYSQDETLLLPVLGAAFWLSWRAKRKNTAASILLATCFWALSICIKMNTLFEAAFVLIWLFYSYWQQFHLNLKTVALAFCAAIIMCSAYFSQAVWSYYCLGVASLFPPAFNANNRNAYMSGAIEFNETFIAKGKIKTETGYYCSNGTLVHALRPFSEWASWRAGKCNTVIDCDKKLYITIPAQKAPLKKRALLLIESIAHYFVCPSWPDDRPDDLIQNTQIQMRWLWPVLALAIIIMALYKKRAKEILVIITIGCSLAYCATENIIIEGRYRKPWEGIAIATFLFLSMSKKHSSHDQTAATIGTIQPPEGG